MSTRIFCDLCNTVLQAQPAKVIDGLATIMPENVYPGDPAAPKPTTLPVRVEVFGDFCDACKGRILKHIITKAAYAESSIARFGGTK